MEYYKNILLAVRPYASILHQLLHFKYYWTFAQIECMRLVYHCFTPQFWNLVHVKKKPVIFRHLVDTWFIHLGLRLRWINHISPRFLKIAPGLVMVVDNLFAWQLRLVIGALNVSLTRVVTWFMPLIHHNVSWIKFSTFRSNKFQDYRPLIHEPCDKCASLEYLNK